MDGSIGHVSPDGVLAAEIAQRAADHDRDASFPHENFALLAQAGLLNLTAPAHDGGGEAGLARSLALVSTIGAGCASTGLVLAMQLIHVHLSCRNPRWPATLRKQVANDAANGGLINALASSRPLARPLVAACRKPWPTVPRTDGR